MIHRRREQGECRTRDRAYERIDANRGIAVESIAINDVIDTLPEGNDEAKPEEAGGDDLWYPGYVGRRGPCEPEEADGKKNGADDHGLKALFGYDFSSLFKGSFEVCCRRVGDHTATDSGANDKGDEGQRSDTGVPASTFPK